jgi:hypothetical protein
MQRFDVSVENVESCLFGQRRTLNQAYHVRNKHGQGCVKLCTESSLNFGPTTGSTPMTNAQLTKQYGNTEPTTGLDLTDMTSGTFQH